MSHYILANVLANISELKQNPMQTIAAGEGNPIVILNRSVPVFYCVPAKAYEALMNRLENLELNALVDSRKDQNIVKVSLDDL